MNVRKGKMFLELIHESLINIAFITCENWTFVKLQLVFIHIMLENLIKYLCKQKSTLPLKITDF